MNEGGVDWVAGVGQLLLSLSRWKAVQEVVH